MESHEYANLFPMLPDAELQDLAKDIATHGLQVPVTTYQGKILDGRNRWKACEIAGVVPDLTEYTGGDPLAFVVSLNLHRRQLTESQLGMTGGRIAELRDGQRSGQAVSCDTPRIPSRKEAADMVGVGEATVGRARAVLTKGTPELAAKVDSGEITVFAAAQLAKLPAARQIEVVAQGSEAMKEKAKEIRDFGAEIAPAPRLGDEGKRITYTPAIGLEIADKAIIIMRRIADNDKEFGPALKAVVDYCNERLARNNKK